MAGGLALSALGFWMVAGIDGSTTFPMFALASFLFSVGTGPVFTLTTDLVIGSAPPERAGAASALSETSAELGGALGIALFGSIGVAVYRRAVAGALPPDLSAEAARSALGTAGGALAEAARLPAAVGEPLTQAARAAFIDGLQLCALISAAGALALAIFAAVMFRRAPVAGGTAAHE
jgi:DHA2 family multidrug resistance protein-like MFS transporter